MGYTSFTKELVGKVIEQYNPKSIVDLGAQNDFSGPVLPAPYISEWYRSMGIKYSCIDLNGENNANKIDLAYPFFLAGEKDGEATFVKPDIVGDIGTSEHVGRNGAFSWNGIYDCWLNKHRLLKIGGIMVNENPLSQNWPGHGFNYLQIDFYQMFCKVADYKLVHDGIHAAMGNTINGWNLWSILVKTGDRFPDLETFKSLPLKQS